MVSYVRANKKAAATVSVVSIMLVSASLLPATAHASILSDILASLRGRSILDAAVSGTNNVQTMALLKPAMNIDPAPALGGGDITIVDSSALMPEEGPAGTIADIEKPKNAQISTYVVRESDSLSSIAKLFGVSPNTILWANNMTKASQLHVGDRLTILPVTGLKYTVKSGDTLATIAKKYGADATDIGTFNGVDDATLAVGNDIIIPDGEIAAPPTPATPAKPKGIYEPAHNVGPQGTLAQIGYYLRPIVGGVETQGIHGYNAVDLAAPIGTPILASADGDVVVAKEGGWNGGYGSYVVISHDNGSQTLYGHASKVIVSDGQHVVQGQVIAYVGQTGKATGPHVHFEIRNGIKNPF